MGKFEIPGEIKNVETLATGKGVYIRKYIVRIYGKGRWRKMKGIATIKFSDGKINYAEIHWYEANGIGRRDFKVKRIIR